MNFETENIVKSIEITKQPFVWKQFISKNKYRGYHPLSLLLNAFKWMVRDHNFPKKYSPSFLFDHLVIGSNPIITLLLINEVIKNNKTNIKIGLYFPEEKDYWKYDLIKEKDFFKVISKKLNSKIESIDDFVNYFSIMNNVELILIESRYKIEYVENDDFTKGSLIYFSKEENNNIQVNDFIEYQNEVKRFIQEKTIKNLLDKNLMKKLIWKKTSKLEDKSFYCPIVLAKNVYLSSLPQGWLSMNNEISKENIVKYNHVFKNNSFGTARAICSNFELLKEHCLEDILNISLRDNI